MKRKDKKDLFVVLGRHVQIDVKVRTHPKRLVGVIRFEAQHAEVDLPRRILYA